MRIPLTVDFNPMLTVSVFGHLFFLSVLMFLPQTRTIMEKIEPVFMVDLIELPAGLMDTDKTPVATAPVPEPAPVEPVESAPKPVAAKPKLVAPPKASASESILQELDQVAKLEASKSRPSAKKPKQALLEETFRELDALKKTPLKTADPLKPAPLKIDNPLEDFENIKMKRQLSETKSVTPQKDLKKELTLEEKKFQQLSQRKVELAARKKDPAKNTSSLLKELEALEKITTPSSVSKVKPQPISKDSKPAPEIAASLQKKLAVLQIKKFNFSIQTKIRPSTGSATEYSSEIRKLKTVKGSQPVKASKITTRQVPALPGTPGTGQSGASAISHYVGLVHVKILENWKDPLGGGAGHQAQVSFYIFPEGNIGKPALIKSTGIAKLDTLALRAIKLSEPFPPFPKELRRPNLSITVNFDYVAE